MAKLHVLGAGSQSPSPQRQTACYMVETRRGLVLLDAGTGLSRLHDPFFRELLGRSGRLVVLLSHLDHSVLAGLGGLPDLLTDQEVTIALPGSDPREILERFFAVPFHRGGLEEFERRFPRTPVYHPYRNGVQRIDGERVTVRLIEEDGLPRALLSVRDVVYGGCCAGNPALKELATGAALLIHDAGPRVLEGEIPSHPMARAAAREAVECKVQDLMVGGLYPTEDGGTLDALLFEVSAIFPRTALASDMMFFRVQSQRDDEDEVDEAGMIDKGDDPEPIPLTETQASGSTDGSEAGQHETG